MMFGREVEETNLHNVGALMYENVMMCMGVTVFTRVSTMGYLRYPKNNEFRPNTKKISGCVKKKQQ